ncbi:hypothetical protein PI126_g24157 [Phytophthora idaei]|nr:hypothetical protein PI126_g24157 [Phytophthora idaei]
MIPVKKQMFPMISLIVLLIGVTPTMYDCTGELAVYEMVENIPWKKVKKITWYTARFWTSSQSSFM